MQANQELPQPFPVRNVDGRGWEVLIATENTWLPCHTEHDARVIASAPVLEYESLEKTRSGNTFAANLEELAHMLHKHDMGFGSRFFGRRAEEVRREA